MDVKKTQHHGFGRARNVEGLDVSKKIKRETYQCGTYISSSREDFRKNKSSNVTMSDLSGIEESKINFEMHVVS